MQISEYTSPEIWAFGGTSATLRVYPGPSFVDVDGKILWVGIPETVDTPCYEFACTITGRVVNVPVVELPDTTVSPTIPKSTYCAVLFDESDTPRLFFTPEPFTTPAWLASPTTWGQLVIANAGANITWPTDYYLSASATLAEIAAAVTGANAPPMTTVVRGQGKLNIAAADSANPIVAGANTPIIIGTDGIKAMANYANLAAAIASIGSTETELYINEPITSNSCTVPSTLTLQFVADGRLTVNSGQTVTINSKPNFVPGKRYFFGNGAVIFGTNAAIAGVDLGWWTTTGEESTDALTYALASLANCSGGILNIPAGTYTSVGELVVPNGVTIQGQGHTYDSSPSVTTILLQGVSPQSAFICQDAFRNITFQNFRIDSDEHTGSVGILATGTAPDSAFGLAINNVVFNNLDRGIDILSTGGDWQIEDVDLNGCEFYNCITDAVRINTINSSLTIRGGNFAVPAGGTGFRATTCGETLLDSVKFGGDGTGIRTAGPLTSFVILSCENEGNDFFLVNTLSDTAVALTFIGGYIQSPIKISATVNVDLIGTALNAGGLFIIDLGAAPRVMALGCPGWPTCLTDNSGGTAVFPLTTSGTAVDIARMLTVASEDPDTTLPLARFGSAVAGKKFIRIGQWNATSKVFTNRYDLYRDSNGYFFVDGNQASPNNGWRTTGPIQLPADAGIQPTGTAARIAWSGTLLQLLTLGTIYNVVRASTVMTAGRYQRASDNSIVENGLLTDNGTNLQLISGLFQFFGTSASFPALKRLATALQARLADDSGYAPFAAQNITANGDLAVTGNGSVTGTFAAGAATLASASVTAGLTVGAALGVTGAANASKFAATGGVSNDFLATVASASTVTPTGNVVRITGAVNITAIGTTNVNGGAIVTFIFDSTPLVSNGANLRLAGGTDYTAAAGDCLTMVYRGSSQWFEVSRSVNS